MNRNLRVAFILASQTLKRGNKKTSILTIFVLTLIFVNLVFLPALINGMGSLFTDAAIDYSYGNVIIEPVKNELYIDDADSVLKKLNAISNVQSSAKRLKSGATLSHKDNFVSVNLIGIVPEEEARTTKFDEAITHGDFLGKIDRSEIVLGRFIAGEEGSEAFDDLGGIEVGSMITATFSNGEKRNYRLKGIFSGGTGISDTLALVHFREIESILNLTGKDKASEIIVKALGEEEDIKKRIIEVGVKDRVLTWQEKVQALIDQIITSFNALTIISTFVSVVIAVFVLFIIIYINTINKRKQIGILKAIGITPQSIILSYIMMSVFYVISGMIFGSIVLFGVIFYLTQNPMEFATLKLVPVVEIKVVVESIISLLVSSIIAGFIPAWLVTKEPILKAIWNR